MVKKSAVFKTLLSSLVVSGGLALGAVAHATIVDQSVSGVNLPTQNGYANLGYGFQFFSQSSSQVPLTANNPYQFTGNGFGFVTNLGSYANPLVNQYCTSAYNCAVMFNYGGVAPGSTSAYLNVYVINQTELQNYITANSSSTYAPPAFGSTPANTTVLTYMDSEFTNGAFFGGLAQTGTLLMSLQPTNIQVAAPSNNQQQFNMSLLPTSFYDSTTNSYVTGSANPYLGIVPDNINFYLSGTEPSGGEQFTSTNTIQGCTAASGCTYTTGYYQGGGTGYAAVPEPSDLGMMGLGLLMIGMLGLRYRQSRYRR